MDRLAVRLVIRISLILVVWYLLTHPVGIFSNPLTLFALILAIGIMANFAFASREASIQLSLRRNGVAGEGQITRRRMRGGRGGPTFWITYEFTEFSTGQSYRREEMVSANHYYQWQVGDMVRAVVLPRNPRISRLADDKVRSVTIFGGGGISLIFPVYFFGINSILAVFVMCFVIFCANLLLINLRSK